MATIFLEMGVMSCALSRLASIRTKLTVRFDRFVETESISRHLSVMMEISSLETAVHQTAK